MGNSHVGALKRAWDEIKDYYLEQEITFFAARGGGVSGLIVQGKKLVPNNKALEKVLELTSGGKKEIDTDLYDIFVIYGAGGAYFVNGKQFYSKAVIEASLNDLMANTYINPLSFLNKLRTMTDKPVFIGHSPLAAEKEVLLDITPNAYLAGVELVNDVIYHPRNAKLINQPLETIVNGKNTHLNFSKGSKRLEVGSESDVELHPEDDIFHMNDKFGEIWLRHFFENLKEYEF